MASPATGSCDELAPVLDTADDGGGDLLLEFTSECDLGAGDAEDAVDVPDVDDALVVEFEADETPLRVHALVVTAAAIPPLTARSRLTTDSQMRAARTAIVVRRRTWTVPRLQQSFVSGFRRTAALTLTSALSRSRLAVPILPFVYGVIFGGVTVLLATGQLHERTPASPNTSRPSSTRSSVTNVAATPASAGEPAISAPRRTNDGQQAPPSAPATEPARLERGTSGVKPDNDARVVFRGSLGLDSRPQGARVFINGLDVGRTPVDLKNLAVGSRAVRFEMAGYQPWSSVIRVVTDQRSRVTADLRPAPVDRNGAPFDETGIP